MKDAEATARAAREAAAHAGVPPVPPQAGAPPVPAVPEPGEESAAASTAHPVLAAARERLDITKRPDHRVTREDFQFALVAAGGVVAAHPKNPEARSLLAYAEGGLAYVAGKDEEASRRAVEAVLVLRRAGKPEHRALTQLVIRADGTVVPPQGWELAVAFGDARGEAMALLDAAVRDNPRDVRARRARAVLRRIHGLEPDGPEPRLPGAKRR